MFPMLLLSIVAPAEACGGFFCDNVNPVVQTSERILFRVDPDGLITTFIEIQFQGPPSEFAWVIPIAEVIDPETSIRTAPAGIFDALEAETAPRFVFEGMSADSKACGCGPSGGGSFPDTSDVKVVGEAVVGPYAIEIITADTGESLTAWLQINGYQIPATAIPAMDHYVDAGMAFVGVKLQPEYSAGPIDTLVIGCPSGEPAIPLILTSIAAVEDMELVAYVLAPERYVPTNWTDLTFDWEPVFEDGSNYDDELRRQGDAAGGRAWNTEFAMPADPVLRRLPGEVTAALGQGAYLTRFRGYVSPDQMTEDPIWAPDPAAPDVDNVRGRLPPNEASLGYAGLVPFLVVSALLRRRS